MFARLYKDIFFSPLVNTVPIHRKKSSGYQSDTESASSFPSILARGVEVPEEEFDFQLLAALHASVACRVLLKHYLQRP